VVARCATLEALKRNGLTLVSGDKHISVPVNASDDPAVQDVEAGRAVELDALVSAVRELGLLAGPETPFTDALLGLRSGHLLSSQAVRSRDFKSRGRASTIEKGARSAMGTQQPARPARLAAATTIGHPFDRRSQETPLK
jgi:hypothetical protein